MQTSHDCWQTACRDCCASAACVRKIIAMERMSAAMRACCNGARIVGFIQSPEEMKDVGLSSAFARRDDHDTERALRTDQRNRAGPCGRTGWQMLARNIERRR